MRLDGDWPHAEVLWRLRLTWGSCAFSGCREPVVGRHKSWPLCRRHLDRVQAVRP